MSPHVLQLRNSIGAIVHSKTLPFLPKHVSMSANHVVLANERTVFTWHFQTASSGSGSLDAASSSSALASGHHHHSLTDSVTLIIVTLITLIIIATVTIITLAIAIAIRFKP